MTRRTKKAPPIELVDASYSDVVDEFCREFDLSPQAVATVLLSTGSPITRTALHIAIDAGLFFGKSHPDKVAIAMPPQRLPAPSVALVERRTRYVG